MEPHWGSPAAGTPTNSGLVQEEEQWAGGRGRGPGGQHPVTQPHLRPASRPEGSLSACGSYSEGEQAWLALGPGSSPGARLRGPSALLPVAPVCPEPQPARPSSVGGRTPGFHLGP